MRSTEAEGVAEGGQSQSSRVVVVAEGGEAEWKEGGEAGAGD